MSTIGFNTGLSDQLQKIVEQRQKARQQEFENQLKLKDEERKAQQHEADLAFKREQLEAVRQQKLDVAAEKLQKNLGVNAPTTAAQDKQLSNADLPVAGGVTLPSTTISAGGVQPMQDVASPDLGALSTGGNQPDLGTNAPNPGTLATSPATTGVGKLVTSQNPGLDQRTHPELGTMRTFDERGNPVVTGTRVPTLNVGSAADRQAAAQRDAVTKLVQGGDKLSDTELFNGLIAAGYDPDKASATVRNLRPAKTATELSPADAYEARDAKGKSLPGAVSFDKADGKWRLDGQMLPLGAVVRKQQDPTIALINELRLQNARAEASGEDYKIPAGSNDDKIAKKLAEGDIQLVDFTRIFGMRATGVQANRREAVLLRAMEYNPSFNPSAFALGYKFAANPLTRRQLGSLNNVESGVPDLLKVSDAAARTGVTLLNKYIQKGGYLIGGKSYSNFAIARTAFADELSGALGYGSATDMSREMGFDMTDQNLSPENFRAGIEDIVMPFVARKRASILGQMSPYTMDQPNAPPPAATPGATMTVPGVVAPTAPPLPKFKSTVQ